MASYVESVLAPGEKIVHRAAISHWKFLLSYLLGALALAAAVAAWLIGAKEHAAWNAAAAILALIGVIIIAAALVRRGTTELVLTDRRIITKHGLVSRDTVEMHLAKVESLHVNQGLLGRLLDYGDVTVVGTGSSLEPLRGIASPLELRRKLGEVAGPAQSAA
jgi:membrane protein YdbS with pleckstrin-like domain